MARFPWLRGRWGHAVALFSLVVVVLIGSAHGRATVAGRLAHLV